MSIHKIIFDFQFVIAAVLAVAAAAPSSYKQEYKPPTYSPPAYSKPAYSAPAYPAPAYSAPAYKDNKYADITITSQSDERNLDGSSQWRYKNKRKKKCRSIETC